MVDALPPFLDAADFPTFFAAWREGKKIEQIATKFCRAVKKNFSVDQAMLIWKRVQKCTDCLYDPLGNAIFAEIGEEDLARVMRGKNG